MIFVFRRWFAGFRTRPLGPFERGVVALDRGDLADAAGCFTAALHAADDDADRVRAYNKRGIVHLRAGDRESAVRDFAEALALDPAFVPAIVNVGSMLLEDGDIEEAVVHYEAALRIDDRYGLAHQNLAVAYRRLGRRGAAVREMRLANRIDAPPWLRRGAGPS